MPTKDELRLLWAEEFDYPNGLNPKAWNFDLGDGSDKGIPGWGNNEREYYVESAVTTGAGLTITAERQDPTTDISTYYGPAEWTSGKIHTAGKLGFKYGYFEFEAKMPSGAGSWPAIWMLGASINEVPWPGCGEIDIFEGTGNEPRVVRGTLHGPGYAGDKGITHAISHSADLSESFHTFGILWQENRIEWFFNGNPYFVLDTAHSEFVENKWVYNDEYYLIMNLAIGGWFAGDVSPDLQNAQFNVRSIRYYSFNGVGELIRHK